MRDQEDHEPLLDDLDELPAGSLHGPEAPPWLERAVLSRTMAVVRSRRRRRHLGTLAVFLTVYAAGLGTALLFSTESAAPLSPSPASVPPANPARTETNATAAVEVALAPAEILRQVRGAPPGEQRRLLKLAGDAYLSPHADIEKALYCYRQLLELTTPERKGISEPDDSWLLLALKQDRPLDTRR